MFLPQHEVHPTRGVLLRLVECQDPRGATSDLVREDLNEEEWGLIGGLSRSGADRPQHRLKLTEPALAARLKIILEAPRREAPQDLRNGALGLAVAPWVHH